MPHGSSRQRSCLINNNHLEMSNSTISKHIEPWTHVRQALPPFLVDTPWNAMNHQENFKFTWDFTDEFGNSSNFTNDVCFSLKGNARKVQRKHNTVITTKNNTSNVNCPDALLRSQKPFPIPQGLGTQRWPNSVLSSNCCRPCS